MSKTRTVTFGAACGSCPPETALADRAVIAALARLLPGTCGCTGS
jgi:hypothetical protein